MFEHYKNAYKIIASLWRRRYLIVISMAAMSIISLFVGLIKPREYVASVNLLIQDPSVINPYLKDMTLSTDSQNKIEDINARLHSQTMLEKIALKLNLITPNTNHDDKIDALDDLSSNLRLDKQVDDLFLLQFMGNSDKNLLADLDTISKVLIDNLLVQDPSSLRGSDDFFKSQLVKKKEQLELAEKNLSDFTTTNADTLPSFHTTNVERLHKIQELLATKEIELAAAKSELQNQTHQLIQINPELAEIDDKITQEQFNLALMRENKSLTQQDIAGKLHEINQLIQQREDKINQARKVNVSELETLQGQVANVGTTQVLPHSLLLNQLRTFQQADTKVIDLKRDVETLKEQIKTLAPSINEYGSREKTLSELTMDVEIKKDMYQKLLDRYQKTRDMQDLGSYISHEQVKVLRSSQPLKEKGYPLALYFLIGIIGGCLFGVGLAIVLDLFDSTVRYREQLEKSLGLNVLVRIPEL